MPQLSCRFDNIEFSVREFLVHHLVLPKLWCPSIVPSFLAFAVAKYCWSTYWKGNAENYGSVFNINSYETIKLACRNMNYDLVTTAVNGVSFYKVFQEK